MTGHEIARKTRRFLGGTARLLLAGPALLLGSGLTEIAAAISAACRWIEGATPRGTARVATADETGPDLLTYRRAARVLFAGGFDTAAIADLLTESEADVARWVCKRPEVRP